MGTRGSQPTPSYVAGTVTVSSLPGVAGTVVVSSQPAIAGTVSIAGTVPASGLVDRTPRTLGTADVSAPGAGTAAVVSYAAVASQRNVIGGWCSSYDAAPSPAGTLLIEAGTAGSGTVLFKTLVTAAGPAPICLSSPVAGPTNTPLTISLGVGGTAVTGVLSILGRWTEV